MSFKDSSIANDSWENIKKLIGRIQDNYRFDDLLSTPSNKDFKKTYLSKLNPSTLNMKFFFQTPHALLFHNKINESRYLFKLMPVSEKSVKEAKIGETVGTKNLCLEAKTINNVIAIRMKAAKLNLKNYLMDKTDTDSKEKRNILCLRIFQCIQKFHSFGYVHGDIKTDNFVLFSTSFPRCYDELTLIDYGEAQNIGYKTKRTTERQSEKRPKEFFEEGGVWNQHSDVYSAAYLCKEHIVPVVDCATHEYLEGVCKNHTSFTTSDLINYFG